MKKNLFLVLAVVIGASMMMLSSCTKEGPAGPAGANGTDGTNGVDANSECMVCHSTDAKTSIKNDFEMSGHFAATTIGFSNYGADCASCHSHTGYVEYGTMASKTAITCATCHTVHQSENGDAFEGTDYALRNNFDVTLLATDFMSTMNLEGSSNACIQCHQSRKDPSYFLAVTEIEYTDVNGEDSIVATPAGMVALPNHAGPHHAPHANFTAGIGAAGYASDEVMQGYTVGTAQHHSTKDGGINCVECHMGETSETEAVGGHTWVPNLASERCTKCHSDIETIITTKKAEISALMVTVADKLVLAGALTFDGAEYHAAIGFVPTATFEAFWNYLIVYEDHSHGMHNYEYAKALLNDANAKL